MTTAPARGSDGRGGAQPGISALIATFNRAAYLRQALEALRLQTLARALFEVIVVDDGSNDDTPSVVRSFARDLPILHLQQPNGGVAAARNRALAAAKAPIVLFLDDDDVADPGLLSEHVRAHEERPEDSTAVLGYTGLAEELKLLPLMHYLTEVGYQLFFYAGLSAGQELDFSYFWGGRTSAKREFLLRHGGFNPVFRFGCEDIELAWRLSRHGLRVIYDPVARSTMTRALSLADFWRRAELVGGSQWVFAKLHREEGPRPHTVPPDLEHRWRDLRIRCPSIMASARHLDRIALARVSAGLDLDPGFLALLHNAYWLSIGCMQAKGAYDQSRAADSTASDFQGS